MSPSATPANTSFGCGDIKGGGVKTPPYGVGAPNAVIARSAGVAGSKHPQYARSVRVAYMHAPPSDAAIRNPAFEVVSPERHFNR